jgi:hypothetical protein
MDIRDRIDQYDFVEIIQVPESLKSVIDIGDIGVVVQKFDDENFEIECITPDGSFKWLESLNRRYLSKQLQSSYKTPPSVEKHLMRKSIPLGALLGTACGALIGAGLGAITRNINVVLIGLILGIVLGGITGAITAALTVRVSGTTGGVGVGYYIGMLFGGIFGMVLGALIPTSLRMRAHTEGLPVLDALTEGRFATAILSGFLLSILATIVGVWIGGKNYIPRNLK